MNSLDALEFGVVAIGGLWLVTGCAIWCGVRWIWRRRNEVDQTVAEELNHPEVCKCHLRAGDNDECLVHSPKVRAVQHHAE